ncbi:hypothetical protein HPB47_023777 [Ixodes persulcatus]|uniref:Uncharacterized protein n=1 Tax=Ixodes persulcatus TaxID=34615 RepID=A0AC60Q643_IXOPE|nr:hypothetical protein HPB47_023777 [Ixodes persulcatus]
MACYVITRLLRWILSGRELSMEALLQRDYLVSYSVLSVSPRRNYFAVGSIKGHILVFKCTGGANITLLAEDLVHDGRVHSIRWVSDTCPAFLSSGPNGFMILTQLADDPPSSDEPGSVESLSTFLLPRGRQRWATAAILLPPCLFVGDRSGSVHAFLLDDDQDMVEPFRTFQAIHGCNGVTDMKHTEDTLVTSGRDGRILLFSVKNQELRFLRTFWCLTSLEWIGQMVVEGKDLLLCGYHTSNFVVWNTTQQRAVLTVDCGGGHRSWDFATTASLEGIFVCLKMGKIMLHRSSLKDTLRNSCIRFVLFILVPQAYIVTAGEDNIVTVSQVTQEKSNVTQKVVCRLHGHISSVKALAVCKASNLEPSERLLVSVGGRAQMILWKVQASKRCSSESEELLNHRLWSLDKGCQRNFKAFPAKDPLARYMDVCIWEDEPLEFRIATVASDTYLRVFGYSWKEDLTLLVSIAVGEHCLFKVLRTELVTRPKSSLLLTAGNDGMLRFWELRGADEKDEGRTECRLLDTFRRHQSGINALDILVHDNIFTVVSGGDDNSLIVTNSVITEEGAVSELDEMTVANAHDAQITDFLAKEHFARLESLRREQNQRCKGRRRANATDDDRATEAKHKRKREARLAQRRLHSTPAEQFPGATARFQREFVENPFGVMCAVCDRLWFARDVSTIGGVLDKKNRESGVCALRQCIEYSSAGALFLDAEGKWLMSVGIDQRLRTWHRSSSSVQEHCSRISCVPDLAALTCWKKPDGDILVAIAGEGLEITLHENILAAEQATTAGQFIA